MSSHSNPIYDNMNFYLNHPTDNPAAGNLSGDYIGTATTFGALPQATVSNEPVTDGDWVFLSAEDATDPLNIKPIGVYRYSETTSMYVFEFDPSSSAIEPMKVPWFDLTNPNHDVNAIVSPKLLKAMLSHAEYHPDLATARFETIPAGAYIVIGSGATYQGTYYNHSGSEALFDDTDLSRFTLISASPGSDKPLIPRGLLEVNMRLNSIYTANGAINTVVIPLATGSQARIVIAARAGQFGIAINTSTANNKINGQDSFAASATGSVVHLVDVAANEWRAVELNPVPLSGLTKGGANTALLERRKIYTADGVIASSALPEATGSYDRIRLTAPTGLAGGLSCTVTVQLGEQIDGGVNGSFAMNMTGSTAEFLDVGLGEWVSVEVSGFGAGTYISRGELPSTITLEGLYEANGVNATNELPAATGSKRRVTVTTAAGHANTVTVKTGEFLSGEEDGTFLFTEDAQVITFIDARAGHWYVAGLSHSGTGAGSYINRGVLPAGTAIEGLYLTENTGNAAILEAATGSMKRVTVTGNSATPSTVNVVAGDSIDGVVTLPESIEDKQVKTFVDVGVNKWLMVYHNYGQLNKPTFIDRGSVIAVIVDEGIYSLNHDNVAAGGAVTLPAATGSMKRMLFVSGDTAPDLVITAAKLNGEVSGTYAADKAFQIIEAIDVEDGEWTLSDVKYGHGEEYTDIPRGLIPASIEEQGIYVSNGSRAIATLPPATGTLKRITVVVLSASSDVVNALVGDNINGETEVSVPLDIKLKTLQFIDAALDEWVMVDLTNHDFSSFSEQGSMVGLPIKEGIYKADGVMAGLPTEMPVATGSGSRFMFVATQAFDNKIILKGGEYLGGELNGTLTFSSAEEVVELVDSEPGRWSFANSSTDTDAFAPRGILIAALTKQGIYSAEGTNSTSALPPATGSQRRFMVVGATGFSNTVAPQTGEKINGEVDFLRAIKSETDVVTFIDSATGEWVMNDGASGSGTDELSYVIARAAADIAIGTASANTVLDISESIGSAGNIINNLNGTYTLKANGRYQLSAELAPNGSGGNYEEEFSWRDMTGGTYIGVAGKLRDEATNTTWGSTNPVAMFEPTIDSVVAVTSTSAGDAQLIGVLAGSSISIVELAKVAGVAKAPSIEDKSFGTVYLLSGATGASTCPFDAFSTANSGMTISANGFTIDKTGAYFFSPAVVVSSSPDIDIRVDGVTVMRFKETSSWGYGQGVVVEVTAGQEISLTSNSAQTWTGGSLETGLATCRLHVVPITGVVLGAGSGLTTEQEAKLNSALQPHDQLSAYSTGDYAFKDGRFYIANGDMAVGTVFLVGETGPTWKIAVPSNVGIERNYHDGIIPQDFTQEENQGFKLTASSIFDDTLNQAWKAANGEPANNGWMPLTTNTAPTTEWFQIEFPKLTIVRTIMLRGFQTSTSWMTYQPQISETLTGAWVDVGGVTEPVGEDFVIVDLKENVTECLRLRLVGVAAAGMPSISGIQVFAGGSGGGGGDDKIDLDFGNIPNVEIPITKAFKIGATAVVSEDVDGTMFRGRALLDLRSYIGSLLIRTAKAVTGFVGYGTDSPTERLTVGNGNVDVLRNASDTLNKTGKLKMNGMEVASNIGITPPRMIQEDIDALVAITPAGGTPTAVLGQLVTNLNKGLIEYFNGIEFVPIAGEQGLVGGTDNILPSFDSGNTQDGWTVGASSWITGSEPEQATDSIALNGWITDGQGSSGANPNKDIYILFEAPSPFKLNLIKLKPISATSIITVRSVEASNDGATWVAIKTEDLVLPIPSATYEYPAQSLVGYAHYRVNFTGIGATPGLGLIEMTAMEPVALASDFSEGAWTPAISGNVTAGSPVYVKQSGSFRKANGFLTINGEIELSSKGGMSGELLISGAPEAGAASTANDTFASMGATINFTDGAAENYMEFANANGDMQMTKIANNTVLVISDTDINDSFSLKFTATYRAA